ncbi:sensor histidine kinase [Bryobacter aggregatus]|uniref:sensor histidine kinase n=1 Tax=Bryobacter aggregatus TaxID=360054 RepID=UPI0004E17537|nr:response regulator [Bryobacter aggregatus]
MHLTLFQLAEFRHRVRSDLNQILGYAELLSIDGQAEMPPSCIAFLNDLQNATRRILHTSQWLFNGDVSDEATLRASALESMGGILRDMEHCIGALLNELPPAHLSDLQRIQSAFIGLRSSFDQPVIESLHVSRGIARTIDVDEPYSATVPTDLRIQGRLLVVDDSEANRQLLDRQLMEFGLDVEMVETGEAALEAMERQQFDCVLLDMMLPGMDGPTVLKAIRGQPDWIGVPVVMLSALDELSEAARCIDFGATDYIIRPTERSFLRAKLHSAIRQKYLYEDCQKLGRVLEVKNEELKRFVMVASHDLQAPLRTIETNLRAIQNSFPESEGETSSVLAADCLSRCHRMSSIVQDLLVYARLGQVEPFIEVIELDWVLSEAMANLQEAIESTNAQIVAGSLPCVEADFKQMLYLFQNLIGNAIKYAGMASPQILIESEERADSWLLAIRDNGIGIEEDQWQRIFEPFHRLHGDSIPGSGLGLAIAQRAVEQAGGKIWVNSVRGAGSTFLFTLPKL